ncbi:MAG TPA: hypothetical protein VEC14_00460, partial [Reyranellaceae bacterium]|nr:hypothetical protein [Reyranellaceae bacterium]
GLAVGDLHLAAAVGGVDSHWKIGGQGRLAKKLSQSRLALQAERTDAAGRASAEVSFESDSGDVITELLFEERSDRALAAALLGRPDLDAVTFTLKVRGSVSEGKGELAISAGDAVTATGTGEWKRNNGQTLATLGVVGRAAGLPDGDVARLFRTPVSLSATATIDTANIVVDKAVLDATPGRLEASGRYRTADDALELTATFTSEETGTLAPFSQGVGWRGLSLALEGTLGSLSTKPAGSLQARLGAEEVTVAGPPLPPVRDVAATVRATVKPEGRLSVESLDLASSLLTANALGNYRTRERSGEAKASVAVADLAPLSAWVGAPLSGRADLAVSVGMSARGVTAMWKGRLAELGAGGVPADLLKSEIQLTGIASRQNDGSWRVREAKIGNEAANLTLDGRGRDIAGDLTLVLALPEFRRLGLDIPGNATINTRIALQRDGAARVRLEASGQAAGQPLTLTADMLRDAQGAASAPQMRGRWASATLDVSNFSLRADGAAGRARLTIEDLADIGRLTGASLGGRLELDVATEPTAADEKLTGRLVLRNLRGLGDLSTLTANIGGEFSNATLALQAAGGKMSANLRATLQQDGEAWRVALQQLDARQDNIPIALTAPLRGRLAGDRFTIEQPGSFKIGPGTVKVAGTVDATASALAVELAALPLATLKAFAPELDLDGTLQAKARVTGALAMPRIEATYAATGVRLRRPGASFLPPMA